MIIVNVINEKKKNDWFMFFLFLCNTALMDFFVFVFICLCKYLESGLYNIYSFFYIK